MMQVEYPTDEYRSEEDDNELSSTGSPMRKTRTEPARFFPSWMERRRRNPKTPWHEETSRSSSTDGGGDVEEQRRPTSLRVEEAPPEDNEEEEEKKSRWCSCLQGKRVQAMYTSADWWSLWLGLISFAAAFAITYSVQFESGSVRSNFVIPIPMDWARNPLDAWDFYNLGGAGILLFAFLLPLYLLSRYCMGKLESRSILMDYIDGFFVLSVLAVLALWAGANAWCKENGIGYAVFAILLGMLVGNTCTPKWLERTAGDGEFFIKCSLVLLAVQYTVLVGVGGPALAIAWVGSPLAVLLSFFLIRAVLDIDASLAVLVSMGSAWCGASAISAVAPIVNAKSEDVSLTISVVALFTVAFTFIQPYAAIYMGLSHSVAGAWIGASVDQTGNVVASGAILGPEALEVASIVKMVLNAGLGFMASLIGCWWNYYVPRYLEDGTIETKKFSLLELWDKFPKFVLGFLITSGILTLYMEMFGDTVPAEAIPRAIQSLNRWWFALAFAGIGVSTNVGKLFRSATQSGIIWAYLMANAIDICLALGLAIAIF